MSSKLWAVEICIALFVLLLVTASLVLFYNVFWLIAPYPRFWEFFWLSVLLQVVAGFLLGVSQDVLLNLRKVRFSPKEFIALVIIPIIVLVYSWGSLNGYWSWWYWLPNSLRILYIPVVSVWFGIAIGKAFRVEVN